MVQVREKLEDRLEKLKAELARTQYADFQVSPTVSKVKSESISRAELTVECPYSRTKSRRLRKNSPSIDLSSIVLA
eukprot:653430-Rhodomonas_salina.3